jgi:hypothetical protein
MGAGSSAALPFSASTIGIYSALPEKMTKEQCIEVIGRESAEQLWSQHSANASGSDTGDCDCNSFIFREKLLYLSTIGTLNKKKERNFKNVFPKIQFLNFNHFKASGEFPRFDAKCSSLVNIDDINTSKVFIVFVSHTWLRSIPMSEGTGIYRNIPHPDSADNTHYQVCVEGIERVRQNHVLALEECYVWIDYSCLDQEVNPVLGLEELDSIMSCCDCIFTPIVDRSTEAEASFEWDIMPEKSSGITTLGGYTAEAWSTYLSRAWTRLEMVSTEH